MSATQERERAIQAARTDFPTALELARRVSEPWYRAQALAWVARFAPEADVEKTAGEALEAAGAGNDTYQQVAASAWALRALVERGRTSRAADTASRLVRLSDSISPLASRIEALFLLWQAVWPLNAPVRQQVRQRLVEACRSAAGWRAERTLQDVVLMLASEDPAEARRILEQMPEGRYRRQAQKQRAAGQTRAPRPFFW